MQVQGQGRVRGARFMVGGSIVRSKFRITIRVGLGIAHLDPRAVVEGSLGSQRAHPQCVHLDIGRQKIVPAGTARVLPVEGLWVVGVLYRVRSRVRA